MRRFVYILLGPVLLLAGCDQPTPLEATAESQQLKVLVSQGALLWEVERELQDVVLLSERDKHELAIRRFGRDELLLRKVAGYPRTGVIEISGDTVAFLFFDARAELKDFTLRHEVDLNSRTTL